MILFAPLQGYTDSVYRKTFESVIGGIDEYYAPFLRLEKGIISPKALMDNEPVPRLVPQLLIKSADELKRCMDLLGKRERVDLNFGCPFAKVVQHGYGAGILKTPEKIREIMQALSVFPDTYFSVKLRLASAEITEILNDSPLCHIVLHPRTAQQGFSGTIDLDAFPESVKEN